MNITRVMSTVSAIFLSVLLLTGGVQQQRPHQLDIIPDTHHAAATVQAEDRVCKGNANLKANNAKMMKHSIETYPFTQSLEQADVIVKLQIIKCSDELHMPSPKTLWQANVVTVWKGESVPEQIYVLQEGNSKANYVNNKMLEPDGQYILFLKQAVSIEQPNSYWIVGGESNIYQVTEQGSVVKHAYPQEELADIEQKELTSHYKNELNLKKQIQVVAEQPFYEKITGYLQSLN